MKYTVKQLAEISNTTVKTLHHYDAIGLLKPAFIGDNNYRYYGKEELLSLQQILLYRELGFPLKDIDAIIKSDDFNKLEALRLHKEQIKARLGEMKTIIDTIDKTMNYLEGEVKMKDEELFYGFDSERQKKYEAHLIKEGVCTKEQIDNGRKQAKKWSKAHEEKFKSLCDDIHQRLAKLIDEGEKPESEKTQAVVKEHHQMVSLCWVPNREKYIGLSEGYRSHPDWDKFFNHYHPKLQDFLCQAMKVYAENNLS